MSHFILMQGSKYAYLNFFFLRNMSSHEFIKQEQQIFDQEVAQVQNWWKQDRFRLVTRPYSAQDGNICLSDTNTS